MTPRIPLTAAAADLEPTSTLRVIWLGEESSTALTPGHIEPNDFAAELATDAQTDGLEGPFDVEDITHTWLLAYDHREDCDQVPNTDCGCEYEFSWWATYTQDPTTAGAIAVTKWEQP